MKIPLKPGSQSRARWSGIIVSGVVCLFIGSAVLLTPGEAEAACGSAPDPRSSPSGYARWCRCMGGTPYTGSYGGPACRPASKTTTPSYQQQPSIDYGAIQRRQEEERRRREEEERKKQELEQAEKEAERREEAARRQFEQDKSDALVLLKSGTGALAPRTGALKDALGGGLELKSGTPTLGLKQTPNPTRDQSFGGDLGKERRQLSAVEKQLACATSIISPSFSAARRGDGAEVRYLGGQARRAMLGQTLEVQCGMSVPGFEAGPVALKQLGPVFETLGVALEKQADRINRLEERIENATYRRKEEQARIEKHQAVVKRLQNEIGPIPPPAPGDGAEEARAARDREKKKKENALREALAALREATKVLASVEKTLREDQAEKIEVDQEISRLESHLDKALKNPSRAAAIEKQISN